jgi:hypothetical protein
MKLLKLFEDTYSEFKGVKPYKERKQAFIDSIKSFQDITNETIPIIVDYFGYEGFNTPEDAIEDLTEKIDTYKKFSDPVTLYRIVGVKNKKMIRTSDMGEHFTPYEWNLDGDMLNSIGHENWDNDTIPYVIVASVPLSAINVWQTIIQNLAFPNEHEINLNNNGQGAKIIKSYKLM